MSQVPSTVDTTHKIDRIARSWKVLLFQIESYTYPDRVNSKAVQTRARVNCGRVPKRVHLRSR